MAGPGTPPTPDAAMAVDDAAAVKGVRWGPWLAWTWWGLVVLCAIAELLDLEALRLALDFQDLLGGGVG